jgi:hypothetical protein
MTMASGFYNSGSSKKRDKLILKEQIQYLVPRIYAAIACELWDMGWEAEQIEELFAKSQERWEDSTRNGWDMLQNVEDVTGIKVSYFRDTGNIV